MRLIDEIFRIKSDTKTLKNFGFVMAVFFAGISVVVFWKHRAVNVYYFLAALLFLIPAIFKPAILLPIQKVWMALALCMGWVMTRVILTAFFYFFLTPLGLLARLFRKNFLECKIEPEKNTYWDKHKKLISGKTRYENQF